MCEIEATYLVPAGSPLKTIADVDKPGVRIAVTARSAYGLWLERNIKHAELVRSDTLDSAYEQFVRDKLEALAGLRPRLLTDVEKLPGARILDGQFTAVQQADRHGAQERGRRRVPAHFVEEAKASGLVARLIERHKVRRPVGRAAGLNGRVHPICRDRRALPCRCCPRYAPRLNVRRSALTCNRVVCCRPRYNSAPRCSSSCARQRRRKPRCAVCISTLVAQH